MAITIPQGNETAGTIITSVRDLIPDPVYTNLGVAQPDTDGSFLRAQSLYRWLSDGIRDMTRRINWTVEDWWAMPLSALQNVYTLDARWHQVRDVFVNQYRCTFIDEPATIYPSAASNAGSQSLTFSWHKRAGALDLALWYPPAAADPATTLTGGITGTTDTILVTSSTTFLSYGWLRIDNELLRYQRLGTNQVSVCQRGQAGTTTASHSNGATVTHCGLWVKGVRSPNPVTQAADPLEVPLAFLPPLETYLLSRCRAAEQEYDEARALMKDYEAACTSILGDPVWQQIPEPAQLPAYGSGGPGVGVWPLGPFGTIVP